MMKRQIKLLSCVVVVSAAGLGAAAPSAAGTHTVRQGQSIQKAVDAAKSGDTIRIAPGTYRESVLIKKPGLTLVGSGPATVIAPAAGTGRAANACAQKGSGICVLGTAAKRLDGVRIASLRVSGFKKYGVWASGTDRLSVLGVVSEKNGIWGIAQEKSVRGVFRHDIARNNGDSGIVVANVVDSEGGATDTKGTVVRDNRMEGNRIGVTLRRVRNLAVEGNDITGNCGGVFVVGDESKPAAGAMSVSHNQIYRNNKSCAATTRLPAIKGTGIVLTGSEDTLVSENTIQDNTGSTPLSGGVVLYKSFVGVHNNDNVVRDNVLEGNKPADLANRDTGKGNTFDGNRCRSSEPAGMC
jgi:nitrous oxidase accessory protein NosD